MKILTEAIAFAMSRHNGQVRRNGEPYFWHLLRVADMLNKEGLDETTQVVAVLHDVLEDTATSEAELSEKFGMEVTSKVKLLTKPVNAGKDDIAGYIRGILSDPVAREVKNADRLNNLWDCIHVGPIGTLRSEEDQKFAEKYISETEAYFLGRFSKALDESIAWAKHQVNDPYVGSTQPWYTKSITTYAPEDRPVKDAEPASAQFLDMLPEPETLRYIIMGGRVYAVRNLRDKSDTESWKLCEKGWLPISVDFSDPDIYDGCQELSLNGLKKYLDGNMDICGNYLP